MQTCIRASLHCDCENMWEKYVRTEKHDAVFLLFGRSVCYQSVLCKNQMKIVEKGGKR